MRVQPGHYIVPLSQVQKLQDGGLLIIELKDDLDALYAVTSRLGLSYRDYADIVRCVADEITLGDGPDVPYAEARNQLTFLDHIEAARALPTELRDQLRQAIQCFMDQFYEQLFSLGLMSVSSPTDERPSIPYYFEHLTGTDILLRALPY